MATLKDVAKLAGLTTSTVSRVINNRGYISENTRKKVDDAMKDLNYHPNEAARSLRMKSTNTIGLIVPHVSHPYFAEMISNLEARAYEKGYKILLCNSQCIHEREEEYIRMCINHKVAGIILCSGSVALDVFDGVDVPVITIERFLDNRTASIECDNKQGGALAAEKLIECGCKHLLHVGNIGTLSMPADMRTEGFREVCERKKIPFVEIYTEDTQYYRMEYDEMLENVLQKYPETDGMFVNSDVIAAQTLQTCRKFHISVPDQLKIIGFDDTNIAQLTTPQLTTIHQPVKEMAEIAINLLNDSVAGKLVAKRTVLPVNLIERETT
ncbi:LacI family DNA-binding transcriptional regulator [Parablautia muri]|uniref:LacI family transcriptional regulator n=1 Tax=Parablautia muri TaxID=2320879 RepID=A0A9X5BH53_9FIRM|nr:LacI family DNA-binding transcriptional regulator [Parablautia muri]NBJ93599.1 LacI family transcriptional regulator [Parablautia muri]